jgi:hypothetical protein
MYGGMSRDMGRNFVFPRSSHITYEQVPDEVKRAAPQVTNALIQQKPTR